MLLRFLLKDFSLIKRSESGTYTPTLTGVANVDSVTSDVAMWSRIGNIVHVSGRATVDPTAGAASTEFAISLPVPSLLSAVEDASGIIAASTVASLVGTIRADATNDRAEAIFISLDGTSRVMRYIFQYRIR